MIEIGKPAPAFTLPDQDGKSVSLSDLRGRWAVVYFYPKDDTPGCTTEACEFTASIRDFEGLDAVVLGVSPDAPASHKKFATKYKLKVRLLSDTDKKVLGEYDAYGEKVMYGKKVTGVIRSTVIVDPEGNVAHHWARVKAAGHAQQVREVLLDLRGAAKGIPTETSTKPGKPVATPKGMPASARVGAAAKPAARKSR